MVALSDTEEGHRNIVGTLPPFEAEPTAIFELWQLLSSPTYLGNGVPRGFGRPVIVLPGFLGSDEYLLLLRGWLRRMGYDARASGIAFNWGTTSALLQGLLERVDRVADEAGERLVLVGHSLGGIFARALLLQRPNSIAHAITLGSPLRGNPRASTHPIVRSLAQAMLSELGGLRENEAYELAMLAPQLPLNTRLTSIYTRTDGVVQWRSCIDADPRADAIEVHGTHTGLAWNVEVYRVLAELLASTGP